MILILSVLVGIPLAMVLHELGHVSAARLAGMRIQFVGFGADKVLAEIRSLAGVQVVLRSPLIPGVTIPVDPWLFGRGGLAVFMLGGVFASVCALVLGGWILVSWGKEARWAEVIGIGLIISNALILPPALLGGVSYSRLRRRSEFGLAARLLAGKVDSATFPEAWVRTLPLEYRRLGETLLDMQIASRSGNPNMVAAARRRMEERASDPQLPSLARMHLYDSLATGGLIKGDRHALDHMDEWTTALFEMAPDDPSIMGSRGAGLVAIGRSEEGVALLRRLDFDRKNQRFEALMTTAFLARGLADLGDHAGAAAGIASARRLLGDMPEAERTSGSRAGFEGMLDRLDAEISALPPR